MEAVKAFNLELSSLYEVKPPISKAKMTAITRGAIKAIKFYKHVVQSVEKFILKCKPEYKVPGLYVIDSIVRQSRHQFGPEKDVFAPRFSKNLQQTFVNLFKCPPEDKSKIIRVLNLWQKNQVFPPEVIQPLFDLADPNNPIHQQMQQSTPVQQTNGSQSQVVKGSPALQRTPTKANQTTASEAPTPNLNLTEPVLQQLQNLQRLLSKGADAARPEQVHFDKKLLDFDYGEDEDEVNPSPRPPAPPPVSTDPVTSLLTNPEVLRQLQTLQNTLAGAVNPPVQDAESERIKKMQEMKMQEDEFDKHLAQTVPNLPFAAECDFKISQSSTMIGGLHFMPQQPDVSQMGQGYDSQHDSNVYGSQNSGNDVEVITLDHDDSRSDDERYKRKRSRSRSRDRGRDKDRRRRSRSRSRSRGRRHRSKSKDRKEKDKKEKEKESERDKERKKRGLPAIKKDHLSVCSTTLWVGHLSKLVHQDDLSNTFGEFGDIVSIDLIVPRGCAFIVMHRRQDAARCLAKLKNHNLHGKAITLAWAPGKGVKGKDLKDYWEGDLGVSYIPWNKLKEDMDLEALEDGGMIDEDTMPDWMRKKLEESAKKAAPEQPPFLMNIGDASNHSTVDTSQPPPLPPTSLMQPPMLPMVNPFQLNNRFLGMIPNMTNLANLPLGVPPPNIAPPNMPPSMMPNLGLGLSSPFQGPPSYMPPTLPPPQTEAKPAPPPTTDTKLRNLSESLMNLAGPPLTMPPQIPMNQPPPPLHTTMDDNMDVEMEDAGAHPDMNKPPPNIPLSEQLQASMNAATPFNRESRRDDPRFSPRRDNRDGRDRRDDRSNDRNRRRSRSRDRDRDRNDRSGGRDRDRRDRDNRDRDFGRGGRDRERDRDGRDRRGGDRDRGRWVPPDRRDDRGPPDRRDDRRDGPFDRRGGPPDRREGPMGRRDDRRDGSYDRSRRDLPDRRDADPRDKSDREKSLNDRLKEMAGMKFDEQGRDDNRSPRGRQLSESKDDAGKDTLRFEPPAMMSEDRFANPPPPGVAHARSPTEARNPSPPDFSVQPPAINAANNGGPPHDQSMAPPNSTIDEDPRMQFVNPPPDHNFPGDGQYDHQRDNRFGHDSYGNDEGFGPGGSAPYNYDNSRPGPYGPAGGYGSDGPGGYGPDGPGGYGPDGPGGYGPDGPGGYGPDGPGGYGPDGRGGYGPDGPGGYGSDGPGGYGSDGPGQFGSDGPGRFGPDGPGRFGPDGPRFRDQGPPFGGDSYGLPPDMMMDGPPGFGPDFGPPPGFDGPPDGFIRGGRRGRGRGRGRGRDGPDFFPRDDFGPPMGDEGFGPPMRDDFGPPMRGDFGSRGPRMRGRGFFNRGGPRGRGGPPFRDGPPGFMPEFEGGPPPDFFRGGPRGRTYGEPFHRGGRGRGFRGGRGRHDFFDGPPPEFFDGPPGHPEGGPPIEGGLPYDDGPPGEYPVDFGGRKGRERKRNSRWASNEDDGESAPNVEGDGGGTPLRDEIDDCGQQDNFEQHQGEFPSDAGATPVEEPHEKFAASEEQGGGEGGEGEGGEGNEGEGEAAAEPAE